MGVSRDWPNFLGTPIISGTVKATDFKLCRTFIGSIGTKDHEKMLGIAAVGVYSQTEDLLTILCTKNY